MPSGTIYLGPYNDPLDATGKHHWDTPHAPDCRNPAISVVIASGILSIDVAVQNTDVNPSLGNTVTLYGAFRTRTFNRPVDVDSYITKLIFGAATPPILSPSPWTNQTIPGRMSLGDNPWRPPTGTVLWSPSSSSSQSIFVIVLTVQSVVSTNATQNPLVGVWVGP